MTSSNKKIFIAGSRGFLGRVIFEKLKKAGYRNVFPASSKKIDLTDLHNCVRATRGANLVINAAGIVTSRRDQITRPASIFYTNSLIELQLLEACRINKIPEMISICSITAYGDGLPLPLKEKYLLETAPQAKGPFGFYGLSKWIMIPAAISYAEEFAIKHRVLIFPNLYGTNDKFEDRYPPLVPNFIKMIWAAMRKKEKTLVGGKNPLTELDLLFVDDAADFVLRVIDRFGREQFLAVNVGSGKAVTVKSVAEAAAKNLGYNGTITWDDKKSGGKKFLDNAFARRRFGWRPRIRLKEGIKKTIGSFLKKIEKHAKK